MNKSIVLPTSIDKPRASIFMIWLVTISGIIGISMGYGDWFLPKTPFNLLLGMGLLYWNFPASKGWFSFAIWSVVFLIGMGVETLGVNYGLLFGDYRYGDNLGPKVMGVPPLIGINWVVLTFLSGFIARQLFGAKWLACLAGAALMVALDFFIEPVAPVFDFWHWDDGHAPLQNFAAWFFVALLLQFITFQEIPDHQHRFPWHHFASQAVFFVFFYVFYQI